MYVTKLSRFSISYDYGTFYYYHQCYGDSFTYNSTTNANQSATIVVPTGGTGTYTYSYDNGGSYGPSSV
jgi:hypothetical protein